MSTCGGSSRAHHSTVVEPSPSGSKSMALSTTDIKLLRNVMSLLDTFVGDSSFAHSSNFVRSGNSESMSAIMSHSALLVLLILLHLII